MRLPLSRYFTAALAAALISLPASAGSTKVLASLVEAARAAATPGPVEVPAAGTVEVAFSPKGGGQELVVKTIDSARTSIRLMAYSFTSAPVTAALLRAKKRGVDVALVVDHKSNVETGNGAKSRAALGALAAAGAAVRTVAAFAIAHDKVIVVDGRHVQTGSFNYSSAAENKNSENIIVLWNAPRLAAIYLEHWTRNWEAGSPYTPAYAN